MPFGLNKVPIPFLKIKELNFTSYITQNYVFLFSINTDMDGLTKFYIGNKKILNKPV